MKKLFKSNGAFAVSLLIMILISLSAQASYVISVYKSGGSELVRGTFPDSGDEKTCEFTIPDYTGNPSDYNYWIGNGAWDSKSCEFNLGSSNAGKCNSSVSGTDYISSCASGSFSVAIWSSSGDKNYYPHSFTCLSTDCKAQDAGAEIPAGTIIFYDNSNSIFSGDIWLSVPTDDTNGKATSVNTGSYVRKNDNWYQMTNIEGDIWQAVITNASSYGRMSFWNKDGSSATDVWQNTVVFQAPYTEGKNVYKGDESKDCYNSGRQSDVYFQGTWSTRSGLNLTLSTNARKATDLNPITLTAHAIGISGTTYKFEYKSFDADEWSTLATQSSPEYVLSGTKLPTKSTSYRVTYGGTTSSEVKLSVLIDCAEGGSAKNILKYDFGTLASLSGDNSRTSSDDMAKDYTYKPWAKKINDGHYAVVSTPYHCGCGDGGVDEDVTVCEAVQSPNMWFRDIKDHTLGDKGTEGNYGAMLMINFSDSKSKIAYEHILTAQEKAAFVKGSTLSFSAYFASAAKESSTEPINMKLKIDYKAVGSEEWVTKAELNNNVVYSDNWKYGNTSIDIDDPAGDYRVVIENNGKAGMGNDALIDDISLDLCVPTFPVEFYDVEKDSTYTEHTFLKMDEKQVIRIPKQDYGHGDANCVFLLSVDPSKAIGEAGRFKVIDEMIKTTYKGSDYYYIARSANELLGGKTGSGKLQAFVTLPDNCTDPVKLADIKAKIENGTIKPLDSSDYMFSTNLLSYDISCNEEIRLVLDKETPVCEAAGKKEMDMPIVKVYFGYISTFAYFSAVEDGTITLKESSKIGQAALNNGYITYSLNSDLLKDIIVRTPGQHTFTFTITEYANAQSTEKLCEKSASFTLEVVNMPNGTLEQSITKCDGVTKPVAVTANYTETYQWQVNTSVVASDWQDIQGATTANYTIPANATDGSQYQVVLGNQYCASQTSSVMNLTVETCDKVVLTMEPATQSICKGDEATFNLSVKNLGTVATNVNISEEAAALSGFDFVSATPSKGAFASGVWAITGLAKDETATMTVKYKSNTSAEGTEKFYVSKLGDDTWTSYDLQTDDAMKASSEVKSKEISSTPEVIDYNECQQTGNKALADLVTSDKTALQWFSNRELTEPVIPAEFDMNVPVQGKSYFVVNTEDGKCVSEKAVASVTVRAIPAKPDTKNYNECASTNQLDLRSLINDYQSQLIYTFYDSNDNKLTSAMVDVDEAGTTIYKVDATTIDPTPVVSCTSEKATITVVVRKNAVEADITAQDQIVCKGAEATFTASTTTVLPDPKFTWYSDAALTQKLAEGATYKVTPESAKSYYISVQNAEYCENLPNTGKTVSVSMKYPVESVELHEIGGATETPVSGVPTVQIAIGEETNKLLVVTSQGDYIVKWYANDTEFDGEFPKKPYVDQIYKAVVTDECGNTLTAQAGTQVIWPTIITPQVVDGFNDDFVVDMDQPLAIIVYDRTGNVVYKGSNGWPNESAQRCMPGVYYYVVTLPDNLGVKKGTVEVYKK